jgi:hypothetical protein
MKKFELLGLEEVQLGGLGLLLASALENGDGVLLLRLGDVLILVDKNRGELRKGLLLLFLQ